MNKTNKKMRREQENSQKLNQFLKRGKKMKKKMKIAMKKMKIAMKKMKIAMKEINMNFSSNEQQEKLLSIIGLLNISTQ